MKNMREIGEVGEEEGNAHIKYAIMLLFMTTAIEFKKKMMKLLSSTTAI